MYLENSSCSCFRDVRSSANLHRLIALFELADMTTFGCSQIVACVGRSERTDAMELVRSLGWCGFSLTTLEPWMSSGDQGVPISDKWLFLVAEV